MASYFKCKLSFQEKLWRSFDDLLSHYKCTLPEDVLENYRETIKSLVEVRKRLKNPVNLTDGRPLKHTTVYEFKRRKKHLTEEAKRYRRLIKYMVKYNLLPADTLIDAKGHQLTSNDRTQFIISLEAMLEFPFLARLVHYVNQAARLPDEGEVVGEGGRVITKKSGYENVIQWLETGIWTINNRIQGKLVCPEGASSMPESCLKKASIYSIAEYKEGKER